jgi:hypothetical protein
VRSARGGALRAAPARSDGGGALRYGPAAAAAPWRRRGTRQFRGGVGEVWGGRDRGKGGQVSKWHGGDVGRVFLVVL